MSGDSKGEMRWGGKDRNVDWPKGDPVIKEVNCEVCGVEGEREGVSWHPGACSAPHLHEPLASLHV